MIFVPHGSGEQRAFDLENFQRWKNVDQVRTSMEGLADHWCLSKSYHSVQGRRLSPRGFVLFQIEIRRCPLDKRYDFRQMCNGRVEELLRLHPRRL